VTWKALREEMCDGQGTGFFAIWRCSDCREEFDLLCKDQQPAKAQPRDIASLDGIIQAWGLSTEHERAKTLDRPSLVSPRSGSMLGMVFVFRAPKIEYQVYF
jgi:hypothetical protein